MDQDRTSIRLVERGGYLHVLLAVDGAWRVALRAKGVVMWGGVPRQPEALSVDVRELPLWTG